METERDDQGKSAFQPNGQAERASAFLWNRVRPPHAGAAIQATQSTSCRVISSRNTHTDTPRTNVSPDIRASHSPVKLTHKMCHKCLT